MLPEHPTLPNGDLFTQNNLLQLCNAVFENTSDAMLITDPSGRILAVNPAFVEITGYSPTEAVGQTPSLLRSGLHDTRFYEQMWESLNIIGQWQGELTNRRKDGSLFPADLHIISVKGKDGALVNYVGIIADLTARNDTEKFFKHIATHDSLTNLANRSCFYDHLNQAIYDAKFSRRGLAVLFIDLDGFKTINDHYGHEIGDQLLQAVADRLVQTVRTQDSVARMGGDEFTVILPDLENSEEAAHHARVLLQTLARPYLLDQASAQITASIGVVTYPGIGDNAEALVQAADDAMYSAKIAGKNQVSFNPTPRSGSRKDQFFS